MKISKKELDVDFIGGEGSLTKEEEIAISQFIISQKEKQRATKKTKTSSIKVKTAI